MDYQDRIEHAKTMAKLMFTPIEKAEETLDQQRYWRQMFWMLWGSELVALVILIALCIGYRLIIG